MSIEAGKQTSAADGNPGRSSAESIDQVRDLLFGAQMREFNSQMNSMSERFSQENAAMRSEFDRRVAELQQKLDKTTAELDAKKLDAALLSSGLSELAKRVGERR